LPLEHSSSDAALHRNMAALYGDIGKSPHVKSRAQAQAIAFETQRRAGRDMGGVVNPMMMGAGPMGPMGGAMGVGGMPMMGGHSPMPGAPSGIAMPSMPGMAGMGATPGVPPVNNVMPPGVGGLVNPMARPLMNAGGALHRDMGGFNVQKSPHLAPSWETKQEARGMMHGPILSTVPGRTDHHLTRVPSGSYILPASHISSMGQSNSVAGLAAANAMFGLHGPYGANAMKMGHGPGAPKPPHMAKFAAGGYSEGGARGEGDHVPVDVALSGGEFAIHPIVVRNIGRGSLRNGHKILDQYVMNSRKKELATIKGLPPPAKK
jgi:hypothetical protein